MTRLTVAALHTCAQRLLEACDVPPIAAAVTARYLVDADCDGVASHGVGRLPNYLRLLQAGTVRPHPQLQFEQRTTTTATLDAGFALGQVAVDSALTSALETARRHGSAWVSIRRCSHIGALAGYLRRATDQGLIALIMTHSPPAVAPHGARTALFGTNPLGIGIPLPDAAPFLLDMATSVTSRGAVLSAQQLGRQLPPGIALSAAGTPTTDPSEALHGALLPFGGAKGSGLALAVELLAAALGGASLSADLPSFFADPPQLTDVGVLLAVLDPAGFGDPQQFAARALRLITLLADLPAQDGCDAVLYPGQRRAALRAAHLRDGVTLSAATYAELNAWCGRLACPPLETAMPG